jgi:syntaxin-binding protein 1
LPITEDVYSFDTESGKRDVLLNENDILWPTLRHKHIADTSSHLISSFRMFIASNAAVKFKSSDVNTLADMSKVRKDKNVSLFIHTHSIPLLLLFVELGTSSDA